MNPEDWKVIRAGEDPLLREWPNPDVVKMGNHYYGFADPSGYGKGWPGRQLAMGESRDGINWSIRGYLKPDSDTPADHVPEAFVLQTNAKPHLYLFYACQIGGEPYNYRYNRIRVMRWNNEEHP